MIRMNKPACFLLVLILVAITLTGMAESAPFKVAYTVPNGWTNAESIEVALRVEELAETPVAKLEYKLGKDWQEITEGYRNAVDGRISITVTDNAILKVRITDPDGQQMTDEKEIDCFDREAPKVSAVITGSNLDIVAQDQLSGVAGIQVNGLLFTVLDGDSMSIPITDTLSKYERLAIRAFDYAGNFTEPVSMINTCYEKQPDPTPAPVASQKPKQDKEEDQSETDTSDNTGSSSGERKIYGASSVYVSEKASYTGPTAEPVPTPTPIIETVYETEYITLGPGMPYQSDGNSHTLDMLYSAATNKQFITLQTKSGNTFYLVIDYDKPIDEDAEMYETYFLNLVDERDLLALMSDDEKEEVPTPTPQIVYVTPEPTTAPVPTAEPIEPVEEKNPGNTGVIALVAILAIGGVLAFLFLKKKDGTPKYSLDNDFTMEDGDGSESDN